MPLLVDWVRNNIRQADFIFPSFFVMAKTKGEMQVDYTNYHRLVAKARSKIKDGHFEEGVRLASNSWAYVDGMMQFERKYLDLGETNVDAIEIVLEYAPFLFEFTVLDELEALLQSNRKIVRNASDDLESRLAHSRTKMSAARRLWNLLEENLAIAEEDIVFSLDGTHSEWHSIIKVWVSMGVICRTKRQEFWYVALATNMNAESKAKCPSCGAIAKGAKHHFLNEIVCPNCSLKVTFVFSIEPAKDRN